MNLYGSNSPSVASAFSWPTCACVSRRCCKLDALQPSRVYHPIRPIIIINCKTHQPLPAMLASTLNPPRRVIPTPSVRDPRIFPVDHVLRISQARQQTVVYHCSAHPPPHRPLLPQSAAMRFQHQQPILAQAASRNNGMSPKSLWANGLVEKINNLGNVCQIVLSNNVHFIVSKNRAKAALRQLLLL
jgi:hypothetical protein